MRRFPYAIYLREVGDEIYEALAFMGQRDNAGRQGCWLEPTKASQLDTQRIAVHPAEHGLLGISPAAARFRSKYAE